jgi:hypothetical protein
LRPGWGWAGRPGWRPGVRWAGRPWRPGWGWGWGFPIAAGIIASGAWGGYYDQCYVWDGWQWVNVCYQSEYWW